MDVYGIMLAPRPLYVVKCEKEDCGRCRTGSVSSASSPRTSSSMSNITEVPDPDCTPKADSTKQAKTIKEALEGADSA